MHFLPLASKPLLGFPPLLVTIPSQSPILFLFLSHFQMLDWPWAQLNLQIFFSFLVYTQFLNDLIQAYLFKCFFIYWQLPEILSWNSFLIPNLCIFTCLLHISFWWSNRHLKTNLTKIKFSLFTDKPVLSSVFFILANSFFVLPVLSNLGVILDSSLSVLLSPLESTVFKFCPESEHFYLPPL